MVLSSLSDLRERLLNLGSSTQSFTVRPGTDSDLYLEHVIVDAQFYGLASKETVVKEYAAKIWLDERQHVVKYQEIIREETTSGGLLPSPKLSFERKAFKGKVLFKKEKEVAFGLKKPADPSSFGKAYQYSFDVRKIRDPVKNLVEANGWKFEQVVLAAGRTRSRCTRCGDELLPEVSFCSSCGQKVSS